MWVFYCYFYFLSCVLRLYIVLYLLPNLLSTLSFYSAVSNQALQTQLYLIL